VEREEQRMRAELERRVSENTAEIVKANEDLQHEVFERKRIAAQMEATYKELLTASRQAGMTEVATNVLHNVGNVLNSVNISASLVADHIGASKVSNLSRVAAIIREHPDDLGHFITHDTRGQQLPVYLLQLADLLTTEQNILLKEIGFVKKKVEHIKDIVAMQQNYAKVAGLTETVMVTDLVEDALQMNVDALARHDVEIIRDFSPKIPQITVEKHKVLQVLVNLVRNAKYACDESGRKDKRMTVRVTNGQDRIRIAVIDNGIGIPAENLKKIFNHGFTTRKEGHGFGLHGGSLAAKDMGGSLVAHSDGPGKGAAFTLELPVEAKKKKTGNTSFASVN
jgi:C4-dicarboxylate-specific signal transduction histidine kinase